jgi:hypothetical protein
MPAKARTAMAEELALAKLAARLAPIRFGPTLTRIEIGPKPAVVKLTMLVVALALATSGCSNESVAMADPPLPDRASFDTNIYPMLLRDCGFSECHGAEHRFFQVFGPGRSRLAGHPSDPDLGPRERQLTYDRTRSMLVAAGGGPIFASPLLTKPLETGAGGASHEGVDHFGRNVFQTVTDPRYVMLWQWAVTQQQALPPPTPALTPPPPVTQPTEVAPGPTVGALLAADASTDSGDTAYDESPDLDASVVGSPP